VCVTDVAVLYKIFKLSQGEAEQGGDVFVQTVGTRLPRLQDVVQGDGNLKEGCDFVNENRQLTGFDFRMWNGGNYVKDALFCAPIAHCSRQIEAERERSARDTGRWTARSFTQLRSKAHAAAGVVMTSRLSGQPPLCFVVFPCSSISVCACLRLLVLPICILPSKNYSTLFFSVSRLTKGNGLLRVPHAWPVFRSAKSNM
jgi:hypothetical protein